MTTKRVKLKDVCKIEKGKIGITKAVEGEYPLVVTAEERSSHNEWHFDEPATIVPLVSSTGHGHASIKRLHYAEGKYAVGNILATLIPKDHEYLNAKYLYVYLTINKEELLVSKMTGAANVSLTLTKLKEVEIEIPEYETQLKIIEKFEQSQKFKGKMVRQIKDRSEIISTLRQQILQDAITGKLSNEWRKDNTDIESAEVLLKKIKAEKERLVKEGKIRKQKPLSPVTEEEIPFELPEGWVWCRLKDLGYFTGGGTPSKNRQEYWGGQIPWVSPKDMKAEEITDTQDHITEEAVTNSSAKIIPTNSILIVGRSGILKRILPIAINSVDLSVNQDMKVIVTYNKELTTFVKLLLQGSEARVLSKFVKYGMTVHSLKYKEFENMVVALPGTEEIKYLLSKTSMLLTKLDSINGNIKERNESINLLDKVFLQEIFNE